MLINSLTDKIFYRPEVFKRPVFEECTFSKISKPYDPSDPDPALPININGSARKDSANFFGSAGDGSANINANYNSAGKYTYFNGFFGSGIANYDVREAGSGYYIWGNNGERNISMNVNEYNGKLSGFWGRTGKKQYSLNYGYYGNDSRSVSGSAMEDSGRSDFVNLNINEYDSQLVINGMIGKKSVYLAIDFQENGIPEEFKKQLEIGAIQMLL